MKSIPLSVFPRTLSRRGGAKKLRTAGRVPAVIYGRHAAPQNLEVDRKQMVTLLHHAVSENLLLDLSVEGDERAKRLALLREIQHHVLSGKILHIDFQEVQENEQVTVQVPVETSGEAIGVKNGGVLEHVLHKIKLRGLPKDLPEVFIIDVTNMEINQSVHIGDLVPPAGVTVLGDKHNPVVAVAEPLTEEQEAAAEATATTATGEVEMIKEKKEEGEEGAAPAKAGEKAPAKAGEKAPAKAGEKAAEKPAEKKK